MATPITPVGEIMDSSVARDDPQELPSFRPTGYESSLKRGADSNARASGGRHLFCTSHLDGALETSRNRALATQTRHRHERYTGQPCTQTICSQISLCSDTSVNINVQNDIGVHMASDSARVNITQLLPDMGAELSGRRCIRYRNVGSWRSHTC
jgi:hypothetical protein